MTPAPLPPEALAECKRIAGQEYGVLGPYVAAERGMAWMMEQVCATCGATLNAGVHPPNPVDDCIVHPWHSFTRAQYLYEQERRQR